jgi:3-oxoacyl-[acyl-carrier protein] reductase
MDFGLNGRVAVITGCSVGIGREVAKVLAGEGVQTVVIARRGALLQHRSQLKGSPQIMASSC